MSISKETKSSTDQNLELSKVTAGITKIVSPQDTSFGQMGKTGSPFPNKKADQRPHT